LRLDILLPLSAITVAASGCSCERQDHATTPAARTTVGVPDYVSRARGAARGNEKCQYLIREYPGILASAEVGKVSPEDVRIRNVSPDTMRVRFKIGEVLTPFRAGPGVHRTGGEITVELRSDGSISDIRASEYRVSVSERPHRLTPLPFR
jgi:hypothetical protein